MKGEDLDTERVMHTGEMPGHDEGRDRGDASTSQGPPECQPTTRIWERDLEQILSHRPHEEPTLQSLHPTLLASGTVRQEVSIV